MFSLLTNTHNPKKKFQKLNEIHRRRLSNWNRHTDSLLSVARSHHCHQALTMINNATNDSLASWIVLWILTYPVLLVKAMRLLVHLRNGSWVTDLCPTQLPFLSWNFFWGLCVFVRSENMSWNLGNRLYSYNHQGQHDHKWFIISHCSCSCF